jgi:hypothetical protein
MIMVASGFDRLKGVALNTRDVTQPGVERVGRDPELVPGATPFPGTYGQRVEGAEQTAPGSEPGATAWPANGPVDRGDPDGDHRNAGT